MRSDDFTSFVIERSLVVESVEYLFGLPRVEAEDDREALRGHPAIRDAVVDEDRQDAVFQDR